MKFSRRPKGLPASIDITALIDIMFILNIFFMLNAHSSASSKGIEVHLPKTSTHVEILPTSLVLVINDLDQIQFDGRAVTLPELREQLLQVDKKKSAIIQADRQSSYGRAMEIFDLLRALRFEKVSLETLARN